MPLDLPGGGKGGVPSLPPDQGIAGGVVLSLRRGSCWLLFPVLVGGGGGLQPHHLDLVLRVVAVGRHVLYHRLAGLEELVLRGEELVVDAVGVPLLAPPLVAPDLPTLGQTLVP